MTVRAKNGGGEKVALQIPKGQVAVNDQNMELTASDISPAGLALLSNMTLPTLPILAAQPLSNGRTSSSARSLLPPSNDTILLPGGIRVPRPHVAPNKELYERLPREFISLLSVLGSAVKS